MDIKEIAKEIVRDIPVWSFSHSYIVEVINFGENLALLYNDDTLIDYIGEGLNKKELKELEKELNKLYFD